MVGVVVVGHYRAGAVRRVVPIEQRGAQQRGRTRAVGGRRLAPARRGRSAPAPPLIEPLHPQQGLRARCGAQQQRACWRDQSELARALRIALPLAMPPRLPPPTPPPMPLAMSPAGREVHRGDAVQLRSGLVSGSGSGLGLGSGAGSGRRHPTARDRMGREAKRVCTQSPCMQVGRGAACSTHGG